MTALAACQDDAALTEQLKQLLKDELYASAEILGSLLLVYFGGAADAEASVDVATRKLSFGDGILPVGPWDWVIASDCVYANDWKALAQTVRGLVRAQDPPPRVILTIPHRRPGPVLSDAFRADAKGLRASTLEVERTPKHDGGGRLPSEQMVAVSVIELSRAGEPEEMRRQSSRQQL